MEQHQTNTCKKHARLHQGLKHRDKNKARLFTTGPVCHRGAVLHSAANKMRHQTVHRIGNKIKKKSRRAHAIVHLTAPPRTHIRKHIKCNWCAWRNRHTHTQGQMMTFKREQDMRPSLSLAGRIIYFLRRLFLFAAAATVVDPIGAIHGDRGGNTWNKMGRSGEPYLIQSQGKQSVGRKTTVGEKRSRCPLAGTLICARPSGSEIILLSLPLILRLRGWLFYFPLRTL
jgi:hypothetical protein